MQHLLLSLLFVAATLGMSPIPAPSHDGDDVIIEIKNAGGTSSGLYIGAKYYIGGTLGYMTPLENAFVNQFSIQCTGTESVNTETLTSEIIDNEMPVILGISQHDGFGHRLFGHAVVADAAKRIHVTRQNSYNCTLEDENGIMTIYHKTETIHELTPTYLGMNWGANGSFMYSGGNPIWFSVDTLSWTTGSYTWDTIEYMIYDFHV